MNILTEKEIDMLIQRHRGNSYDHLARAIESAVLSKLAEQTGVVPVAHLRFWAAQYYAGHGNIEFKEGFEVTTRMEPGVDGSPAFPVFTESQLIAAQQRTAEACARYCAQTLSPSKPIPNDAGRAWVAGTIHCTDGIRNGEWREYL